MKNKLTFLVSMLVMLSCTAPEQKEKSTGNEPHLTSWKSELEQTLKLFGHRNWIVVADAAYPQQSNPAIKTVFVDASQLEAVELVSQLIEQSSHVYANIYLDKELAFVPEKNAKGIDAYRDALDQILYGKNVTTMLHEDIIRKLDTAAELFHVLIIKTDLTIPYTSVFFQLEAGYWNAEAEESLRKEMNLN